MNFTKEKYFHELHRLLLTAGRELRTAPPAVAAEKLLPVYLHREIYRARLRMSRREWSFTGEMFANFDSYLTKIKNAKDNAELLRLSLVLEIYYFAPYIFKIFQRTYTLNRAPTVAESDDFDWWLWGSVGTEVIGTGAIMAAL